MTSKSRKNIKRHNKTSKRVLEMKKDPTSVWGKNKPLEQFWQGLASGKYVVVIYKNGKNKRVNLPKPRTKKSKEIFNNFDADNEVVSVLSSSMSQDDYEMYLYPKAKDKSVDYVIKNYKKFFKSMGVLYKDGLLIMKKVMVPS